jgi:hypothetical protein
MSVALCAHRFPNASFCKRRAREGSRFCGYHRADEDLTSFPEQPGVNPLDRLTEISDVFAVVRETLNSARLGRIPPGQVYAVCAAVYLWLKVERKMGYYDRKEALESQYVSSVLDAEASAGPSADDAPFTLSPPQADEGPLEPEPAVDSAADSSQPPNGDSPAFTQSPPQAGEGRRDASSRNSSERRAPAPLTGDALTRAVLESVLRPLRGNGKVKRKAPA